MDPATASALAMTASSVGSGIAGIGQGRKNRKTAERNVDRTIQANKEEAELAYQRQVEMWNRQNAYNTPEAQMNRFKEAGLNPHLIYGQGNAGNAAPPPAYQPPDIQYKYLPDTTYSAIGELMPAIMQAGTWMQNMKLSEAEINKKEVDTQRSQTAIELANETLSFLKEKYPKVLKDLQNNLDLFPYQKSIAEADAQKASVITEDFMKQFMLDWGEEPSNAFRQFFSTFSRKEGKEVGLKEIDKIKKSFEASIKESENKLKEAQASWTEYGITSPQALMQMVISGLMAQVGMATRYQGKSKTTPKLNQRLSRSITTRERSGRIVKRNIYE